MKHFWSRYGADMCRQPPLVYFWIFLDTFGYFWYMSDRSSQHTPFTTLYYVFLLNMRSFLHHHDPSYAIHSHPCWYIPVRWNRRTRNRPGTVGLDWKLYLLHEPFWTILVQRLHFRPWSSKGQRHFLKIGLVVTSCGSRLEVVPFTLSHFEQFWTRDSILDPGLQKANAIF